MQNAPKHCIWLTFKSDLVDSVIFELSKKYNTQIFQAHCTIIGKTDIPLIQLKSAIISMSSNHNIDKVSVESIGYRNDYWMSYYLTVLEKQFLIDLHNNLKKLLKIDDSKKFLPHISLMYCSLSEDEKVKINVPIKEGDVIITKSIQITECKGNVEKWKPVFELLLK